jgi:hypothetical protein
MTTFSPSATEACGLSAEASFSCGTSIKLSDQPANDVAVLSRRRVCSAQTFTDVGLVRLLEVLAGPALLAERRWDALIGGDAAFAIGIALPVIGDGADRLDLVMGAVLLCALGGSGASALVLAYALRHPSTGRTSWQVSSVAWIVYAAFGSNGLSIEGRLGTCRIEGESLTSSVLHAASTHGRRA